MKFPIFIVLSILPLTSFSTGQASEKIVYQGDTLELLCEPLEQYLLEKEPRKSIHPFLENGCSTALWRGYIGLWKLDSGKLYLIDVFLCGQKSRSIKHLIFPNSSNEIFADWFSEELYIEKGRVIKYNHFGYDRQYESEVVITLEDGIQVNKAEYSNGVQPDDNGFSRNPEHIFDNINKLINWEYLPRFSKNLSLVATIVVSDNGKLDLIEIDGQIEEIYINELKSAIENMPNVQIFFSRGKPLNEGWNMKFEFSKRSKRKYAS